MDEPGRVRDRSEYWSVEECCWVQHAPARPEPQAVAPAQRTAPQREAQPALS